MNTEQETTKQQENSQENLNEGLSESPKQNELNLDFDEMEPITPKKVVESKPTIFAQIVDKLKGKFAARQAAEATGTADSIADENNATPLAEEKGSRGFLGFLPAKYHRLAITLFGFILLLFIFFSLKPDTQTVDNLQAENLSGSVPIEYQPIDQTAQPVENNPSVENTVTPNEAEVVPTPTVESGNTLEHQVAQQQQQSLNEQVMANEIAREQAVQRLKDEEIKRAEQKAKQEQLAKQKAEQEKALAKERARAQALLEGKKVPAPVVDAVDANMKVLTIPQGTSLMQVFRDNQLNISDVNAMTKANGGEKALSSFKPGDKVKVKVVNGRVAELQLSNGGRFIRQSNGTYLYKK